MNVVDIIIILILLIYMGKGFKNGVIKESVSFLGGLGVIIIAFLLKNPISVFMYQHFPFFEFSGLLSGISVLNIIIYELVAFLVVASVLLVIYQLLLRVTNVLETILKITFVFALPSKLLGALVGLIEGIIVAFLFIFISVQFTSMKTFVDDSKYGHKLLSDTPFLSSAVSPAYESIIEIYKVADQYQGNENRDEANLKCLEVLLKYKVLKPSNAEVLVDKGKLKMPGVEEVIDKYKTVDEKGK